MTRLTDDSVRSLASHYGLDPEAAVGHYAAMMEKQPPEPPSPAMWVRRDIVEEVLAETARQDEKWGEQNHPNGTGPDLTFSLPTDHDGEATASVLAAWAKSRTDDAAQAGAQTYEQIATEEFFEALAEVDPIRLRTELIQLQAVCLQWVAKIDRDAQQYAATVSAARFVRSMLAEDDATVSEPCS